MRLKDIRDTIVRSLPLLKLSTADVAMPDNMPGRQVSGLRVVEITLRAIRALPLGANVQISVDKILRHPAFTVVREPVLLAAPEADALSSRLGSLWNDLTAVAAAMEPIAGPLDENRFSVRLPPFVDDAGFSSIARDMSELSSAIDQPLQRILGVKVTVVGADRGSWWLDFIVREGAKIKETALFLTGLVGAWHAYKLAQVQLESARAQLLGINLDNTGKAIDNEARGARLQRETMINEMMAERQREYLRQQAREVMWSAVGRDADVEPEHLRVVENSIRIGSRLLARGVAVDIPQLPAAGETSAPIERRLIEAGEEIRRLGPGPEEPEDYGGEGVPSAPPRDSEKP